MKVSYSNISDYNSNTVGYSLQDVTPIVHTCVVYTTPKYESSCIDKALDWLFYKGYITEEEKQNHCSERLETVYTLSNNVGENTVVLPFDNFEWGIKVYVGIYNDVNKVEMSIGNVDKEMHQIWPASIAENVIRDYRSN